MARPRRINADNDDAGHTGNGRSDYNGGDDDAGIELYSAAASIHTPAMADQQPLLTGPGADDFAAADDDDLPKNPLQTSSTASSPGLFVWLLTLSAGLSGLLFGYDTGVISATLVSIGSALSGRPLTSLDKSIITSSTSLLALAASPAASVLADARGRRRVIFAADALFIVGALLQAVSSSVAVMVVGRSIVGAAVGAASFVVPLYIAEAAPAEHRGRLVTVNVLFITLGQVAAYVLGWLLSEYGNPDTAWRWMVGLGAVPALLQAFLVLAMPESPRWLVQAGRAAEARAVIARVQGARDRASVGGILKHIEAEVRAEDEARHVRQQSRPTPSTFSTSSSSSSASRAKYLPQWLLVDGDTWAALMGSRRNRRALTIACLLQGLQQLCGFVRIDTPLSRFPD